MKSSKKCTAKELRSAEKGEIEWEILKMSHNVYDLECLASLALSNTGQKGTGKINSRPREIDMNGG